MQRRLTVAVVAGVEVGAGREQCLHQGWIVIIVGCRPMEGSGAAIVSCFQVGAGRHQRLDHGGAHRRPCGDVQRRRTSICPRVQVGASGYQCGNEVRVFVPYSPVQRPIAICIAGLKVRAGGHESIDDRGVSVHPDRHVQRGGVFVVLGIQVRAGVQERSQYGRVRACAGGPMQRRSL